jgi:ribosome assembly protein RRB1
LHSLIYKKWFYLGSPCLSFDIIPDALGDSREYPLTSYLVAGTQGERKNANHIIVIKVNIVAIHL